MNALARQQTTPTIAADDVLSRIQAYVQKGWTPYLAAERVVQEIVREGHERELLAEVLPALLFATWEIRHAPRLSQAGHENMRLASRQRHDRAALGVGPGERVVDPEVLKRGASLLESVFWIGGRAIRIGDMTVVDLKRAAAVQKQVAIQRAHYARWFHALGQQVKPGQRVRDVYDEAALTAAFEAAQP